MIVRAGRIYTLVDNESTNGTRLNGVRIQNYQLSDKDEVSIGSIIMVIEGDDIESPEDLQSQIPSTIKLAKSPVAQTAGPQKGLAGQPIFEARKDKNMLWPVIMAALGAIGLIVLVCFLVKLTK